MSWKPPDGMHFCIVYIDSKDYKNIRCFFSIKGKYLLDANVRSLALYVIYYVARSQLDKHYIDVRSSYII